MKEQIQLDIKGQVGGLNNKGKTINGACGALVPQDLGSEDEKTEEVQEVAR